LLSVRFRLTAEAWADMAPILATLPSRAGRPPVRRDRLLIEAVLSRNPARTALARPPAGLWTRGRSVQSLAPLGSTCGLAPTLGALPDGGVPQSVPPLYRCHNWARPSACRGRVKKPGGHAAQALGRSRGGWATNLQAGWREERTGLAGVLTAGHGQASPVVASVLAQVPPELALTHALMDKASDRQAIRAHLLPPDLVPRIPPTRNRRVPLDYEKNLSKCRETVERFCNNLKQFRRLATRYEQLSQPFLALLHLVAMWIIIK
jgi:transposase